MSQADTQVDPHPVDMQFQGIYDLGVALMQVAVKASNPNPVVEEEPKSCAHPADKQVQMYGGVVCAVCEQRIS